MSVTCSCDDNVVSVPNTKCVATDYGNQIVAIFYQKMEGEAFDGTSGNDITVEADWDTKLVADGVDRIGLIPYLTGAERPSQTGNVESDNDVPYGGEELIDVPQSITFDTKYLSAGYFAQIEKLKCSNAYRIWFLDNKNYVWGSTTTGNGVENAYFRKATVAQMGIGTRTKAEGHQFMWNDQCEPLPISQLTFLRNKFDDITQSGS